MDDVWMLNCIQINQIVLIDPWKIVVKRNIRDFLTRFALLWSEGRPLVSKFCFDHSKTGQVQYLGGDCKFLHIVNIVQLLNISAFCCFCYLLRLITFYDHVCWLALSSIPLILSFDEQGKKKNKCTDDQWFNYTDINWKQWSLKSNKNCENIYDRQGLKRHQQIKDGILGWLSGISMLTLQSWVL